MGLDLLVMRRGLDPAAATCAGALRELMHVDVAGVERAELWRFEVEPGPAPSPVAARLRAAACRAGRYVNLNRDVCDWQDGPRHYPAEAPRAGCAVDVWVCDGDGRDPVALAYFRARAVPELTDLRRGILWRLWLPGADPTAARAAAEEITVTRGRRHGLLMNPHAQTATILHVLRAPATKEDA